MGIAFWYLMIAMPLVVAFAGGYFLILLVAQWAAGRRLVLALDLLVPIAGVGGIAMAFAFAGIASIDRFLFVNPFVTSLWERAGYVLELCGAIFSGLLSSTMIAFTFALTRWTASRSMTVRATAAFCVAFVMFLSWPRIISLFL